MLFPVTTLRRCLLLLAETTLRGCLLLLLLLLVSGTTLRCLWGRFSSWEGTGAAAGALLSATQLLAALRRLGLRLGRTTAVTALLSRLRGARAALAALLLPAKLRSALLRLCLGSTRSRPLASGA